jgi:hypothetical protein
MEVARSNGTIKAPAMDLLAKIATPAVAKAKMRSQRNTRPYRFSKRRL